MTRVVPSIGSPRPLPAIPVRSHTLSNGLRVLIAERRELPIVDFELVVLSGAHLDAPTRAGRVRMTAEMLDEGTTTRHAIGIAAEMDDLGAHLDVHAGWDAIATSAHVLSERLEPALAVMADVVLNPTFPEDEFRKKCTERLSSLQQDRDESGILAAKALAACVFGAEHPYGAPIGGTAATVGRLARRDVENVYAHHFRPDNAVFTVVGDVSSEKILALLEAQFGGWRAPAFDETITDARPPSFARRVLLVDKPGAAQAELRVGHPAPPRNTEDYFALTIMNAMLGGSFTSRLNTILREQMGVTYGASSHFRLRKHGGLFSAGAAVFTEAAARSAQVVVAEMERMIAETVSASELRRAQSHIALGLPRSFETTDAIAARLREQIVHGLPADYWGTYVDRIFEVSPEDVARVAARHLQPAHCAIVIVADHGKVQGPLEDAGLGQVVLTDVAT